jgi:hypothetical protein
VHSINSPDDHESLVPIFIVRQRQAIP